MQPIWALLRSLRALSPAGRERPGDFMKRFPVLRYLPILALIAVFFAACSRDPDVRKQKFFASGQQYFQQGQYAEASIQFGNAIAADSRFAEAHYQLAQAYIKLGEWNRAFQELKRTVELQPENYPAHIDLANLFISGHDLADAQAETDLLQSKQPDNPLVHLAVANLLAAQANLPGALQEAQKAVALAPDRSPSYVQLALLQLRANQSDGAEASFKKAIELDPKETNARLALGTLYVSRNRMAEAERQFRQAVESDPGNPDPRADMARLYLAQGKKDEAEAFLKKARLDFPTNSVGYRMLGDFYFATGDLAKAATEYDQLNRDHPGDWQVKKNYTQLLILTNRLDEGRKADDEILKAYPNDSDALIFRGQIQVRQGDAKGAITTLQTVIKNDPDNPTAHYHLGVAYGQLGHAEQARAEWERALQLNPNLTDAIRALATLALRQGDMPTLQQRASQLIQQQPASPEGYAMRAFSFTRRSQFTSAEPDASKAISLAPQDAAGYLQMGNLRLAQKQYSAAEKAYQRALNFAPGSPDALSGLMNTYLSQKQVDKAVEAANAQIAKVRNNSGFYDLLGTVLLKHTKNLAGAEAAFRKAIELDKNNQQALIMLGQVQTAEGAATQAIATYERALQDNPGNISFYILLGDLYNSQHDLAKAQDAYHKALAIDSNNPMASNNLAYLLLQNGGDVDQAVSLAQTARSSAPDSPNFADTLGWAFYHKGYYQQSISLFQESMKLAQKANSPDNPTVHYHLGLAYEKSGDTTLAKKELERVLQLNPNYSAADDVKKALAELQS